MRRREFLSVVGLGGSLTISNAHGWAELEVGPQPLPVSASGTRRPRIGSVSWNFHTLAPGGHPEEAIDIIGSLGFEGVELIANSRRDIDEYWTDSTIDRIKKQLERNKLEVNQFPFFQPVVEGLTSRYAEERKRSLDYFEKGCVIAKKLGAPMVNIVAPRSRLPGLSGDERLLRFVRAGSTGPFRGRISTQSASLVEPNHFIRFLL